MYLSNGGNQHFIGDMPVFKYSQNRKHLFQKPGKKKKAKESFCHIHHLSYKTLHVGFKSLCCVERINDHCLIVSLPDKMTIEVNERNISQPYLKLLDAKVSTARELPSFGRVEKTIEVEMETNCDKASGLLASMFRVGQILCCKVINTNIVGHPSVPALNSVLSLNPKDVNFDLTVDDVSKGDLIQMAVASREDDGYQMCSGVPGVAAFLPASNAIRYETKYNEGKPLAVGQLLWCLVKKCNEATVGIKMVTVKINPEKIVDSILEDVSIKKLNPGTLVNATVAKVAPEGVYLKLSSLSSDDNNSTKTPLPIGWVKREHLAPDWSIPKDITKGASVKARVLYTGPQFTGYVCLTLKMNSLMVDKPNIELGEVLPNAKVSAVLNGSILLALPCDDEKGTTENRGYIHYRKIGIDMDRCVVANVYVPGSEVKCRVVYYHFMDQLYDCTMRKESLCMKHLTYQELKAGDALNVTVINYNAKGCFVAFDYLNGFVPLHHLVDAPTLSRPEMVIRVGATYSARILQIDYYNKLVSITLKPTLVAGKPLTNLEEVSSGDSYYGVVSQINESSLRVTFFNGISGLVYTSSDLENYSLHQLVKCSITKTESGEVLFNLLDCHRHVKDNMEEGIKVEEESNIPLKELKNEKILQKSDNFITGNQYSLKVIDTKNLFIEAVLETEHTNYNVRIPIQELSDFPMLHKVKLKQYSTNDIIPNALLYKITRNPFRLHFTLKRSVQCLSEQIKNISDPNNVVLDVPCTVLSSRKAGLLVSVPIPGFDLPIFVTSKYILGGHQLNELSFPSGQTVFVRMKLFETRRRYKDPMYKAMKFRPTINWVVSNLQCFLEEASRFQTYKTGDTISGVVIEDKGNFVLIKPTNQAVSTKNGNEELQLRQTTPSYGLGDMVTNASVLFHNPESNVVQLYYDNSLPVNMTPPDEDCVSSFVTGRVVYLNSFFLLALATGGRLHHGCLIYIPILYHPCAIGLNRSITDESTVEISIFIERIVEGYAFGFSKEELDKIKAKESDLDGDQEKEEVKVEEGMDVKEEEEDKLESVIRNGEEVIVEVTDQTKGTMSNIPLKANATTQMEVIRVGAKRGKTDMGEGKMTVAKRLKSEVKNIDGIDNKNKMFMETVELQLGRHGMTETFTLEDASGFLWDATPNDLMKTSVAQDGNVSSDNNSSLESDGGDKGNEDGGKRKKKMTPAERIAALQEKERRIREKEDELLNIEHEPKSVDHFERLVLSEPNSSIYWVKYMAFLLQATEIEKARGVARRALKQINIREEKEHLNIWIALLNLENLYGTEESLKETLEEALKVCDDYQIYLKVLQIYSCSDKTHELEQLVGMMLRKYKDLLECHLTCLKSLMRAGLSDKARKCLQRSLASIPKKQHVALLTKFALLENEFGNTEEAHALFDSVLTSYPTRVDVWSVYVDMLVKAGSIPLARQVLERASGQLLVARKMKSIYNKWLAFEEKYGDLESTKSVKLAALQYVNKLTKTNITVQ